MRGMAAMSEAHVFAYAFITPLTVCLSVDVWYVMHVI